MKSEYEALREQVRAIEQRKRDAVALIATAERLEHEADTALEVAVAEGRDVSAIRKARAKARQDADDARETIELIEAGRVKALRPYAQAVLDAGPDTIAQVQSAYDAAIEAARVAYETYRGTLPLLRGIEQGSQWIKSAYSEARTITGSNVYIGVRYVDIEKQEAKRWKE